MLESLDLPLGVVLGTFGVERSRVTWTGQAAHAGSTPMDQRRDALAGAAKLALAIRDVARETGDGAVCTSGGVVCRPGIVTSVVETAEQLLDQRHLEAGKLAAMLARVQELAREFAEEERIDVAWERIWSIEPILFDETLIGLADEAIREVHGDRVPPPVRAAPRRGRGLTGGRADRDAVRPEPAGAEPHEARGHEARAPRALRRGARPSRDEDDRPRGGGRVALAPAELRPHSRTAVVAGLIVGCCLTWNVTNVGAVADPLAATYGVSLAAVGLLTTALFVTHLAAQLPAGIWSDRYGPRAVALGACIAAMVGNLLLLQGDDYGLAVAGRLVVGLGSGAGFVAGFDLVRAGGGGTVLQGAFGGATMAGGGPRARGPAGADGRDELARDVPDGARARAGRCPAGVRRGRPPARRARRRAASCATPPAPGRRPPGRHLRTGRDRRQLGRDAPRA